ncbi:DedA family protein [Erwinia amylovora]|nr:YqaA family protein [Erwinia amylovora]CDK14389.1 Inner membrane protein yqaA [Erwinia amylovora LA635]CDK17756.1 Inner membrane protein yqaA [Erwinia amylovora LA636]CDK21125.1 Inner membrane protein yqaA [Erwinia amylovora LA637]MCK8157286.1 DedA family protein [Erwinia amylovora]MCK8160727.1 DedA family protein [Erwinia amylovora]
MSEWLSYVSMLTSSFFSATLLPGSSEAVLVGLMLADKISVSALVITAALGNTLGGLTNIVIGRFIPQKNQGRWHGTAVLWLRRLGPAALLFSWLPVIGDLLCVVAGWLRFPWLPMVIFLAIGKTLRYILLAAATLQGMEWWH